MARLTALPLITRIRGLIHDPSAPEQQFSDDDIQAALDRYRRDVSYLEMLPQVRNTTSGNAEYMVYRARVAPWEEAELVNGSWQVLTPATADLWNGRWTFTTSQPPPVYISGIVHDVYAAAADLLEAWAAAEALSFDVDVDGQALKRSQKHQMLQAAAAAFRRMARPGVVMVERSDAN